MMSLLICQRQIDNPTDGRADLVDRAAPRNRPMFTALPGPPTPKIFMLAPIATYSSEVQQPVHATAVLREHPHTRRTGPVNREQDRAGSLHPEGQAFESLSYRLGVQGPGTRSGSSPITRTLGVRAVVSTSGGPTSQEQQSRPADRTANARGDRIRDHECGCG